MIRALSRHNIVDLYHDEAKVWAEAYHLDTALILAVIQQESAGDPHAISNARCYGLMQLSRYALKDFNTDTKGSYTLYDMRYSPRKNIQVGCFYLHWCEERTTSTLDALRMYNVGYGTVVKKNDAEAGRHYAQAVLTKKQWYEHELKNS